MTDVTDDLTTQDDEETTREAIAQALETVEAEKPADAPQADDAETKPAEGKAEETAAETPAVDESFKARFNGYDDKAREELAKLPTNVQKLIEDRENKFHKGLEQYKGRAQFANTIEQIVAPDMGYLKQYNATPEQYISNMVSIERQLRQGDARAKIQVLQGLANDYGIDLQAALQVPFDPYAHQLAQENRALKQRQDYIQASQQSAVEEQLLSSIEEFARSHDDFDQLKPLMAELLDKGLASTLEEAHAKARRLDDNAFSKYQAQQLEEQKRNEALKANQAAKAAKAAAVSVRGAPTGKSNPTPATTEDAVRQAFAAHGF